MLPSTMTRMLRYYIITHFNNSRWECLSSLAAGVRLWNVFSVRVIVSWERNFSPGGSYCTHLGKQVMSAIPGKYPCVSKIHFILCVSFSCHSRMQTSWRQEPSLMESEQCLTPADIHWMLNNNRDQAIMMANPLGREYQIAWNFPITDSPA